MNYFARKKFKSINEAREEILLSYSLKESDLTKFLTEDVENFDDIKRVRDIVRSEQDEDEFAVEVNYPEINDEYFRYVTWSGINAVPIYKKGGDYLCEYEVESEKTLEYSTAMNTFKKAGWEICSPEEN